jgi:hypothetical protein
MRKRVSEHIGALLKVYGYLNKLGFYDNNGRIRTNNALYSIIVRSINQNYTGEVSHMLGLDGTDCYRQNKGDPTHLYRTAVVKRFEGDNRFILEAKLNDSEIWHQAQFLSVDYGMNSGKDTNNTAVFSRDFNGKVNDEQKEKEAIKKVAMAERLRKFNEKIEKKRNKEWKRVNKEFKGSMPEKFNDDINAFLHSNFNLNSPSEISFGDISDILEDLEINGNRQNDSNVYDLDQELELKESGNMAQALADAEQLASDEDIIDATLDRQISIALIEDEEKQQVLNEGTTPQPERVTFGQLLGVGTKQ